MLHELEFPWLKFAQNILNEYGMPSIWNTQTFINSNWIVNAVKLSLKYQFKQLWHSLIQISPKPLIYRCFKETFEFEIYLEILDNKYLFDFFYFFELYSKWQNIERNRRLCVLCQKQDIVCIMSKTGDCVYYVKNRRL